MQRAILREFDQFYQFRNTPKNIKAVFTNRNLNLGFHNQTQIEKNRKSILSKLNLKLNQLVCAKQINGDNVYVAEQKDKGRGAIKYRDAIDNVDALVHK